MITLLTFLWEQNFTKTIYTAEHVNLWAEMLSRHVTVPHRIACATDIPQGIDSSVEILPLPDPWPNAYNRYWRAANGKPQCTRRLDIYRSDAAKDYGERIWMCDLDVVITRNIDYLIDIPEDFRINSSLRSNRPYNGALQYLVAGARPQVYDRFTPAAAEEASGKFVGSDQAWITAVLGPGESRYLPDQHDVRQFIRGDRGLTEERCAMLFWPGHIKPWQHDVHGLGWVKKHYRSKT